MAGRTINAYCLHINSRKYVTQLYFGDNSQGINLYT